MNKNIRQKLAKIASELDEKNQFKLADEIDSILINKNTSKPDRLELLFEAWRERNWSKVEEVLGEAYDDEGEALYDETAWDKYLSETARLSEQYNLDTSYIGSEYSLAVENAYESALEEGASHELARTLSEDFAVDKLTLEQAVHDSKRYK